ncbi:MAG: hypothetical protein ACREOO_10210 [bacterium]
MKTALIKKYSLFLFFALSSCQRSGPVEVNNQKDHNDVPQHGYYLYVGIWSGTEVIVVDTESNTVVKRIRDFPYSVWDLALTKSGQKLYVCTRNDVPPDYTGKIFSVDLETELVTLIHSKISDVFVSPNGSVFVISYSYQEGFSRGSIGIIDTLTDAITYFDTLDIRDTRHNYQSVLFNKNKPLFYAVNNSIRLFAYDYDRREVVRDYDNLPGPILRMEVSLDGKLLYVAGGPVFDLERDTSIAGVGGNYFGSLALSPDGEYLYVTDPGRYMLLEPVPTGKVFIFQTATNSYVGEIDVKKVTPFGHSWQTDRMMVLPEGRTAYVSNWLDLLFVIDLQHREVKKIIEIDAGSPVPMALGVKPRKLLVQKLTVTEQTSRRLDTSK